ncbi:MAG: M16 family metallopeptidase [Mycobacteriales bacterium]
MPRTTAKPATTTAATGARARPGHSPRLPAPDYRIERAVLGNGLRVLLVPDRSVPAVAVAVHYDVGMRSEPPGRTGFAHLFEHLMFEGSAHIGKLEHGRYVQSAGGVLNGTTHLDYTNYFELVPANALDRMLYLEADRMAGPLLSQHNLDNQISVVKEEIRVNVLNRPYGGFPWLSMPPLLFATFANSHNGYGDFVDLDAATLADATAFFRRYYAPANALLTVVGDFEPDTIGATIDRLFGSITSRRAPARASMAEPGLTGERRGERADAHAPLPAVAAGWRVPDPVEDLTGYLPYLILAEVLTDGDASRLHDRLVNTEQIVNSLAGYLGFLGDPLDARDPTVFLLHAIHSPDAPADRVLGVIDEELDRLAQYGPDHGELDRVRARLVATVLRELDPVLGRAQVLAAAELIHGRAELVAELPALLGEVGDDDVRAAAAALRPDRRAVDIVLPGPRR